MNRHYLLLFLLNLFAFCAMADEHVVSLSSGNEITIQIEKTSGDKLFLWLPSEAGLPESVFQQSRQLAKLGIETWFANLLESYFLPVAPSSLTQIPADDVAELIEAVRQQSAKQVYLVGSGRSTIPILAGARQWQIKYQKQRGLAGVIFISPKLFVETPQPGEDAEILPIALHTNLPVHILQAENSPWRWKMDKTVAALEKEGSDVSTQIVRQVRDRFYYRPDATPLEQRVAATLPQRLQQAIYLLDFSNQSPRKADQSEIQDIQISSSKKKRELKPYKGKLKNPSLILNDLDEMAIDLKSLTGSVVLVNFWASWCPPCVHEMPSMQVLYQQYQKKGFDILAVNMAESKSDIQQFLGSKVNVNFKIVQDKEGDVLKAWQVFAFPTSYLLDKNGNIRYALFGAVDWTDKEIIQVIEKLLQEPV